MLRYQPITLELALTSAAKPCFTLRAAIVVCIALFIDKFGKINIIKK